VSIHVALNHVTHYRYDRDVQLTPQLIRLRPAPHCRTRILSYSQRITPAAHFLNWQQDPQSNYIARVVVPDRVREFGVEIDVVAEMAVHNPFDFFLEPEAEEVPFSYAPWQRHELQPFLATEPPTPKFREYLAAVGRPQGRTIDFLVALNQRLSGDVKYLIRLAPGVQTPEQTLMLGSGSCRDTTWLLVQILRHIGLAARFVSGYLIQLKADVKALDGPSGVDQDFTDLHAWAEVYLPGAGWIGFDPTSGLLAGEGHLPLACTPEPGSAAPITGGVDDCEVSFEHRMSVTRVHESPRVTLPYSDDQWNAVLAAGEAIDAELQAGDVRLTMGGEPTFVAIHGRDDAEWNTEALGPTKRTLAADLVARLKRRFATGAFLHFGQGKWYPGEELPRWALTCYWRRDGVPAWTDDRWFANEDAPVGHTSVDAERFVRALAAHLGITDRHVQPAYEDAWYFLWRERRLPVNVDPFDSRLEDELERDRLARVYTEKLGALVGYALPLEAQSAGVHPWRTGAWPLRNQRMYLVPGDSPMGYRLPIESLPWVSDDDRRFIRGRDTFAPLPPLGRPRPPNAIASPQLQPGSAGAAGSQSVREEGGTARGASTSRVIHRFESAAWVPRFALCVQARRGTLFVFMPPLEGLERYLDLLSAIEATAAQTGLCIVLEGYPPPSDARLQSVSVTPDPGVIEVNVHPARTWSELVETTTAVYDEAHQASLSAEKFMLDGRHTGTGGGNHFVLGGATAADSPFLRRPDLLASLVSYWHNHPSLSYLFSGLFIGPTSQAPRVDEARHDSIYELEIALARTPLPHESVPPWTVDRLFRNLLVDVTGNTHRAEFCIDKMYSPAGSSGRRGLLELRAFEMPPHSRMSLVQQLLLRALVARFWKAPYRSSLVRWGTSLHDRFLLPDLVWQDFEDVIAELRDAGYPIDRTWFRPHFEFRFPLAGELSVRGIEVALRQALEPWHVMGEEGALGGTVRFVDSSLERLQVRVSGVTGDRYVVTCNGRALPLHSTGRNGEAIAGVRYRAWQPASALHPMIPVHAPLSFDIVDTWMEQSLGGGQYHVMHPGGRSFDRFPVNSYEAESRRLSRFTRLARTPGRMVTSVPDRSREFPYTLDLRT
jgi:uncharacterized protein (DUF2126 family)